MRGDRVVWNGFAGGFFPSVRMTVVLMAMAERGITIPASA
jgi:hypothetical protein